VTPKVIITKRKSPRTRTPVNDRGRPPFVKLRPQRERRAPVKLNL
jgi:hypothetical protein